MQQSCIYETISSIFSTHAINRYYIDIKEIDSATGMVINALNKKKYNLIENGRKI